VHVMDCVGVYLSKNRSWWCFSLSFPSYEPIIICVPLSWAVQTTFTTTT
jgi:hypothetical protein